MKGKAGYFFSLHDLALQYLVQMELKYYNCIYVTTKSYLQVVSVMYSW